VSVTKLKTGDHIKVLGRLGIWHHGIIDCRGRGGIKVIHASKEIGLVAVSSLREFSGGQQIYLVRRAARGEGFEIAKRARDMIGEEYCVLGLNCEHVAYGASHGEEESPQLQSFFAQLGGIAAGLAFSVAVLGR
jgi:hypothetical protein